MGDTLYGFDRLLQFKNKNKKILKLWCLTMIDPATGWFGMVEIKNKIPINIAKKVQQTWLTQYPRPSALIFDKETEFMTEFAEMIEDNYGREAWHNKKTQENSILERIHQTTHNMIRTFEVNQLEIDKDDKWSVVDTWGDDDGEVA